MLVLAYYFIFENQKNRKTENHNFSVFWGGRSLLGSSFGAALEAENHDETGEKTRLSMQINVKPQENQKKAERLRSR